MLGRAGGGISSHVSFAASLVFKYFSHTSDIFLQKLVYRQRYYLITTLSHSCLRHLPYISTFFQESSQCLNQIHHQRAGPSAPARGSTTSQAYGLSDSLRGFSTGARSPVDTCYTLTYMIGFSGKLCLLIYMVKHANDCVALMSHRPCRL